MAHLTLMVQGREVRRFVLNPTVTTIGRAQDNDIVINNLALSRRHAEVHFREGRYQVEDVGSQNGVYINAERIRGARPLDPDDKITLGTYQFVFSDEPNRDPEVRGGRARRTQEVTQLESVAEPVPAPSAGAAAEASDDPQPLLVLKYNDVELQRYVLGSKGHGGSGNGADGAECLTECMIGRGKDCDIQIAERRLSRRHCRVRAEGGRVVLEDLGSQNGTFVNRRRIPQQRELHHGDILNFAEYSILFLADASEYDGPDRDGGSSHHAPDAESNIQREETDFAEAYEDAPPSPAVVPPSYPAVPSRPTGAAASVDARRKDPGEPLVERPARSRERRGRPEETSPGPSRRVKEVREHRKVRPAVERNGRGDGDRSPRSHPNPPTFDGDLSGGQVEVRPARLDPMVTPKRRRSPEHEDVDDLQAQSRPDRRLDAWYDQRGESDVYHEEPSVLLERSKSSMSQLLSTMMVDKRELDRNLAVRAKERRFMVEVSAHGRTSYAGPLTSPVTILGRDEEADIKLTGRYVAGRHSLLVRVRDSLLLVRLGSSSAARVNGLPKLQAFLRSGDVIQIDETTIRISEQ